MTKFYGESTPLQLLHLKIILNSLTISWKSDFTHCITGGCHVSNTWQNSESQITSDEILKDWQAKNEVKLVIAEDGTPKILLVSAPAEHEIAFIDWISFTLKRYTFMDDYIGLDESLINDVCIDRMGQKLEKSSGSN